MTAAEPVFVDTNVLVYAVRPLSPQHAYAKMALRETQEAGSPLWISPQVLREYIVVVSRPQAGEPALSVLEACSDARRLAELFNVAEEGRGVLDRLFELLAKYKVGGKQVHDAHLVATMLEANIFTLLTFNTRDFERYVPAIRLPLLKRL